MMKWGFIALCAWIAVVGAADSELAIEVAGPCDSAVSQAISACDSKLQAARAQATKTCGTRSYKEVQQKVAQLKKKAQEQEAKIKQREEELKKSQGKAKTLAGESKKERTKLVADLKVQKKAKDKVVRAEKKVSTEQEKLGALRGADEQAVKDAISKARTSDDKSAVAKAKDKAHQEYRKILDQKINIAVTGREVTKTKKELKKETAKVETSIQKTKAVAEKESDQLKKVAQERLKVANSKLRDAQAKLAAAQKNEDGLNSQKGRLQNGAARAGADAKDGAATLSQAQKSERAAKSAEKNTKAIKLKVGKLDMKKLRAEAKKHALAGTMPPVPGGVPAPAPPPYRRHRVNYNLRKANLHSAKAELAKHKANNAHASVIQQAKNKVQEAHRQLSTGGTIGARVAAVTQMHSSQQNKELGALFAKDESAAKEDKASTTLRETNSAISSQVDHIVGHK